MATAYKATYFLESGKYGWTETWYYESNLNLAAASVMLEGYRPLRLACMGYPGDVVALRTTEIGRPFVTFLHNFLPRPVPVQIPEGQIADNPYNAYLLRLEEEGLGTKKVWAMRGLPDSAFAITPRGAELLHESVTPRINALVLWMRANKLMYRTQAQTARADDINIDTITRQAGTNLLLLGANNHGVGVGQFVRIRGVRGQIKQWINGVRWIERVDANTLVMARDSVPLDASLEYLGNGKANLRIERRAAVHWWEFERYAHKDTGRPFGLPRGRRRARR